MRTQRVQADPWPTRVAVVLGIVCGSWVLGAVINHNVGLALTVLFVCIGICAFTCLVFLLSLNRLALDDERTEAPALPSSTSPDAEPDPHGHRAKGVLVWLKRNEWFEQIPGHSNVWRCAGWTVELKSDGAVLLYSSRAVCAVLGAELPLPVVLSALAQLRDTEFGAQYVGLIEQGRNSAN